ncbi:MAG: hypothetical protein ACON3Z_06715 [Bradymonadia bacterium]
MVSEKQPPLDSQLPIEVIPNTWRRNFATGPDGERFYLRFRLRDKVGQRFGYIIQDRETETQAKRLSQTITRLQLLIILGLAVLRYVSGPGSRWFSLVMPLAVFFVELHKNRLLEKMLNDCPCVPVKTVRRRRPTP